MTTILIVEDQPENRELYADIICRVAKELDFQYRERLASDFEEANQILERGLNDAREVPVLILLDMEIPYQGRMDERGGYWLMRQFRMQFADTLWIPLTATIDLHEREVPGEHPLFDDLYRLQPFAVLPKGKARDLKGVVRRAIKLIQEISGDRIQRERSDIFANIITFDEHFYIMPEERTFQEIRSAAQTMRGILLFGESGAGKALTARLIHYYSDRRNGPFYAIDGMMNSTSLEELLFLSDKKEQERTNTASLLDQLQNGTLYISHFEKLGGQGKEDGLALQRKLLRYLKQNGDRVRLIGGIESTRRNFILFDRLLPELLDTMIPVELPSLYERKEDIPTFVQLFLRQFNFEREKIGEKPKEFVEQSRIYRLLQAQNWLNGNIDQLRKLIEEVLSATPTSVITPEDFELVLERIDGLAAHATSQEMYRNKSPLIVTDEYLLKFGIR